MNKLSEHPKLVTLGIGLAITLVIGTMIGSLDNNQVNAFGFHRGFGFHHFGF